MKLETTKAPKPCAPYSQVIIKGNFIFTSGQIYLTPEGKLVEGTTEEQVDQIMKNLQVILEKAGANFSNVVKTTIYVTDMSIYGKLNEVYGSYFKGNYPARETVCVTKLPAGAKVEISMIAMK